MTQSKRHPAHARPQVADLATQRTREVKRIVILLVTLVAVVLLMHTALPAGTGDDAGETIGANASEPIYISPYDWNNIVQEGTRWRYETYGNTLSRTGIDVSENQHWIDWDAVAADGIDFAFIRTGYRGSTAGDLYADEYFQRNLEEAKRVGVDCGVYFFSQAISKKEAVEEAEYVLEQLKGTSLEYPIAFDSEVIAGEGYARTADLSNKKMTAIAKAFCRRIEEAGYTAAIYGNAGDLARYDSALLDDYLLWWAEYDSDQASAQRDIQFWQYSNAGGVAGIEVAVDMNLDLRGAMPQE